MESRNLWIRKVNTFLVSAVGKIRLDPTYILFNTLTTLLQITFRSAQSGEVK